MANIDGPNIYSHCPIVRLVLDMAEYARMTTSQVEGFNNRLLQLLPSLRSHHCSRGYPGGFLERLVEGTYFGHVAEHIILELLHRCGFPTGYGKTVSTFRPDRMEVVFECSSYRPAVFLSRVAVNLVNALLNGNDFSLDGLRHKADLVRQRSEPGPSTAAIVDAARRRGIPVTYLQEGTSLLLLGYGSAQKRLQATMTSDTACLAVDLAGDKCLAIKFLDRAGIPTPRGAVVTGARAAVEAAHRLGVPVVVKPCDANQGKGISLNLTSGEKIVEAYHLAHRYSRRVMVEEYITGRHYRLLVVGGRLVSAARRFPAQVRGDGKHTIAELIEHLNADPRRGIGHSRPLTLIKIDREVRATLARQKISEQYRPRNGEVVLLRENANLSTGGFAWDVSFKVHPDNAALAERAARVIGLDIAGIDLIAPDIGRPVEPGSGAVVEINASPGIRMHLYPSRGRSRDVAEPIISHLFPGNGSGRIPITAITGTNGKTTTARMLAHILGLDGKQVGLATTEGVFIGGKAVYTGDTTGPRSARMVLEDPAVETAVLETARGGVIRGGLGYDRSDVAVVTNVSADHLGQDGLETIDDLVFVKSLLVESVHETGAVVLNADDPNVLKMLPRTAAPVVLFALRDENLALFRHLNSGGKGLTVRGGYLCWVSGSRWQKITPVRSVSVAYHGLAVHHLQNAMAAAAAAISLQVPLPVVARGLATFLPSPEQNPGRGNLYLLERGQVLLDYGHNPAAFEATLQFARRLNYRRVIGVIGVPGDRGDELIRACGQACAPYLDQVIIKEDRDRRGRRPGEVAQLLSEGCNRRRAAGGRSRIILDELAAAVYGLSLLEKDDLLVVFYEKRAPLEALFRRHGKPDCGINLPRLPENLQKTGTNKKNAAGRPGEKSGVAE